MPTADAILQILSRLPLFQALSNEQLLTIRGQVAEKRLAKSEFLFQKGDPVTGFYIVVHGQVKLAIPSAQGLEKVVEIIGPRQSLGEAVMFLGRPYPVTAQALADTLLLRIDHSAVDRLLADDVSFARRMLAGLSMRLHALIQDVESYSLHSSTQRVIGYLLQHCFEGSGDVEQAIALPTAKHVIASLLNLTPETLSRIFQDLARAGLIEVQGRTIVIPSVRRLREFEM